jgi:drug/metabolite transporter (DMT)-like permease
MTWQFLFAAVAFLPFGLSGVGQWTARDLGLMFLLGALLTTLSQVLFLHSLKSVTSSTASLLTSAQPVVTVLLAFLFLGEVPTQRTLLGGAVISASVVAVALRQVRANL